MQIQLCVAVVARVTPFGRRTAGLCSTFLAQLQVTLCRCVYVYTRVCVCIRVCDVVVCVTP